MMNVSQVKTLAILGVGLIGASFAKALRETFPHIKQIGLARKPDQLNDAVKLGVIDEVRAIVPESLHDVDILLLAVPVSQTESVLNVLLPGIHTQLVITDAGSTKQDVILAARGVLGDKIRQFVPAHPIAGRELSGWQASLADLYQGKHVVLTPLAENDAKYVALVRELWQGCGANVSELSASEHDAIFALTSHFPHLLAFAFMQQIAQAPNTSQLLHYAGSGFRDFTRIAGGDATMWCDILLANREALLNALSALQVELNSWHDFLSNPAADGEATLKKIQALSELRRSWQPV